MEKDIPLKYRKKFHLEKTDCGVDGLFILTDGSVAAYQVKFRTNREKPSYAELSKFWAEARYTNHHYTISNCYSLSELCEKHKPHLSILVDEFDSLEAYFFEELHEFINKNKVKRIIYKPFDFQEKMIANVINGFKNSDRGKLISACGTGKTFTALKIIESMKAKNILFLAPSLALIKQTLESWSEQSVGGFSYLCVCSDKTVSEDIDSGDISIIDLGVPVTTNPERISNYLSNKIEQNKIIFCTYQSLDVLSLALRSAGDFSFDITIFDEAHRTAGAKNSKLFSLALHDQYIKSKKRLFMTATERLLRPWIIKKAEEYNRTVFSMDDKLLYGPVFDRLNFGEAINKGIISDYRIIVAGIKDKEIYNLVKSDKLLVNVEQGTKEFYTYAQNVFRQVMLVKSMQEFPIRKVITFHNTIQNAQSFVGGISTQDLNLKQVMKKLWGSLKEDDLFVAHINGSMGAGERKEILDAFKDSKYGIISNARCLTEGVDVPIIDSIYFVNPKSSLIDIVQACGRALRKPIGKDKKIAYFIVPILIPEGNIESEIINEIDFDMLHNLIQSLRDQDLRLAEWINEINLEVSKGKTRRFSDSSDNPIVLSIPKEFDVKVFEDKLFLQIAKVNGEPTTYDYKTKKYGEKERRSQYTRIFKTLGDYSISSYKDNLVLPTIKKFRNQNSVLTMDEIKINNNNVSHTERLGLIKKYKEGYQLTPLGIQLYTSKLKFEQIFGRQMLRYFSIIEEGGLKRILFPYRACLKILLEVKSINYIEFVFGLYSLTDSSSTSIADAVNRIKFIRENYPNIEILNEKNKVQVLNDLNKKFNTNFSVTDIWEKKTTIYNQFIYFRDHLSMFGDVIHIDYKSKTIYIFLNSKKKIMSILMRDQRFEEETDEPKLRSKYIEDIVIFMIFNICR